MEQKKVRKYGGHALLEKYGPDYFVTLAKKREAKRLKQKLLWEKVEKQKIKQRALRRAGLV